VDSDELCGQPKCSVTEKNVERVKNLVHSGKQMSIILMAEHLEHVEEIGTRSFSGQF
jgi:Glu-tRNA(Gln) amidotransferase subunit E-like FAD-binding protein